VSNVGVNHDLPGDEAVLEQAMLEEGLGVTVRERETKGRKATKVNIPWRRKAIDVCIPGLPCCRGTSDKHNWLVLFISRYVSSLCDL
jgi:hypothetical protein